MIESFVITLVTMFLVGSAFAQRPILGGYKEINVNGANVKDFSAFAVESESKKTDKEIELIAVVKAEQQAVQGTKLRMCLKVSDPGAEGQDAAEVFVQAIVSRDIKNKMTLISWEASDCGETEDKGDGTPLAVGATKDGRFKKTAKNDAGIGLAADFAIKKHSEETKVKHTLVNIIKGENKGLFAMTYRVCMKVAEEGKTQVIRTVVTMDQYSNMKLVRWEHSKCTAN